MAKVECYNCKKITVVIAPKFRCTHCNYPLQKYVEQKEKQPKHKIIEDIKEKNTPKSVGVVSSKNINPNPKKEEVIKLKHVSPKKTTPPTPPKPSRTYIAPKPKPTVEKPIVKKDNKPLESKIDHLEKKVNQLEDKKADKSAVVKDAHLRSTIDPNDPLKSFPNLDKAPKSVQDMILETIEANKNRKPKKPENKKPISTIKEIVPKTTASPKPTSIPKPGKVVAGWLVLHTEGKNSKTYELFEGVNIIGRPDVSNTVNVQIESDKYISRIHCIIKISKDYLHRFHYELMDDGRLSGRPSTNGTFVNGYNERLKKDSRVYLQDKDIIQVGETKLAFKDAYHAVSNRDATTSVIDTKYIKTVPLK